MIVDGRHLTDGERLRLLDDIASEDQSTAPNPAQLEMFEDDDIRYQWKDFQRFHHATPEPPVSRGCLAVIVIGAAPWLVLAAVVRALLA